MKRIAALGLALTTLSLCGPASAAPPPQLTPGPAVYSGYGALASSFTTLTAHWTQPEVTCPPTISGVLGGVTNTLVTGSSMLKIPGLLAIPEAAIGTLFVPHMGAWIGMVGTNETNNRSLVQTGTGALCLDGVAHNTAFFAAPSFGDQSGLPVPDPDAPGTTWDNPPIRSGDDITATITWDGQSTYRLTLANTTRGWHYGATYHGSVIPTGALTVVEAIPYNVPGFSPVTFTDVTADGKPLSTYDVRTLAIDGPHITPTPLTGTTFTIPSP
ncbi:G1 family endopeptidase [Nocardia sp. NBC_01377]|uniref:G1 family glutamic endopeptidase n=1 Tax=Nocardia sp. NBC_01377 TaxID=2903595 RepID=UPI003251D87C